MWENIQLTTCRSWRSGEHKKMSAMNANRHSQTPTTTFQSAQLEWRLRHPGVHGRSREMIGARLDAAQRRFRIQPTEPIEAPQTGKNHQKKRGREPPLNPNPNPKP